MGFVREDFKLDLRKCVAPPGYIWVNSGSAVCSPLPETAMGVRGCFSPPFAAGDLSLSFALKADGHLIPDEGNKGKEDCGVLFAGGEWYPDKIVRKGTYHFMAAGRLVSLGITSELVPLAGKAGFLLRLEVKNRGEASVELAVLPVLRAGHPAVRPLGEWEFMPPGAAAEEAVLKGGNVWENKEIRVTLLGLSAGVTAKGEELPRPLANGEVYEEGFGVVLTRAGEAVQERFDWREWQRETERVWEKRFQMAGKGIPELKSNIPGLVEYYHRSLISGLVCLWENDAYIVNPFPATSGMDGGSLCCYPWDLAGYGAAAFTMMLGEKSLDFLVAMLKSGIDAHISMSLDGGGQGWCSYAYSCWSLINLYWAAVTIGGTGFGLFEEMTALFLAEENRLPEWQDLKDYGRQHNLLEMRSCGYEYFVPSPNAERAWCYDRLADIAAVLGQERTAWRKKAAAIRTAIRTHLWEEGKGWFRCLHPCDPEEHRRLYDPLGQPPAAPGKPIRLAPDYLENAHVEYPYSIQAYDALRMGACTDAMKEALLSHLREGAFLGDYGVSSVSAEDELHYELNDPDWSGGGCYSGDGPVLAETLWQQGEEELAFEVLRRHFWMGKMLPYVPQEHYCDKPGVPSNKRANIIAGTAGLQAILFGMAGLEPGPDGSLKIMPHPPGEGFVEICGYRHREQKIDLFMEKDYVRIKADGRLVYEGRPEQVTVLGAVKK